MDELQRNADTITRVLRRYNVDAQIVPSECFQSSGMNVLSVLPGPSTKVSAVTRLADELDDILTRSLGAPVAARFETKPLRILVPRQQPQVKDALDVIARLQRRLRNERGLLALVGEAVGIRGAELRVADLTGSNTPHWLLAGTTGSGKTTAISGMVASMALLNKPSSVTIWILDTKNDLPYLRGLPSVARVITDADKCVQALAEAVAEMDRRSRHSIIDPTHRLVVVIDELADLLDVAGKEAEMMLKRILQKGRGHGIHVIAGTQYPLADNIGSTAKANFGVRLAFRMTSPEASKVATGVAGVGAERLPGRGAAVKVGANGSEFVQAFNVDKARIAAMGGESVSEYQPQAAHTSYTDYADEQDEAPAPVNVDAINRQREAQRFDVDHMLPRAMPTFAEYFDAEHGELRRGATAAIIRRLFGKSANTGGAYRVAALEVINKLTALHATTTNHRQHEYTGHGQY